MTQVVSAPFCKMGHKDGANSLYNTNENENGEIESFLKIICFSRVWAHD